MRISLNDFNPGPLIALGYRTIEFRTGLTSPIVIDLSNTQGGGSDSSLARALQPAVILDGNLGHTEIAPFGMPDGMSPQLKTMVIATGLGLAGTVFGLLLLGGAIFGGGPRPSSE